MVGAFFRPYHPPMSTTHLLYLHGFRSSPLSIKAQKMAEVVRALHPAVHWWCPQLPPSPSAAMQLLRDGVAHWPGSPGFGGMAVVGSSLGGFYAAALARERGCRAVLINPAVDAARDLTRHIGVQASWHDPAQSFVFTPQHVLELRALHDGPMTAPSQTLAIIAKGDEVLDWREMLSSCSSAQVRLVEGSDHALSDFNDHLPAVLEFLDLA